mmetsp:Transcript_530/g.1098  ORF Transcript_530/g.1098 Transcript_530/m.1098 type:complete len:100 (-) Transcript_530:52-351(-)
MCSHLHIQTTIAQLVMPCFFCIQLCSLQTPESPSYISLACILLFANIPEFDKRLSGKDHCPHSNCRGPSTLNPSQVCHCTTSLQPCCEVSEWVGLKVQK